ncbi:MAG: mycothiol conjugate amidase Mca [Propionibacteriales bacterium]|nr:mycothiol conjugate amidase Mca [Propionibacteriales bacterium]
MTMPNPSAELRLLHVHAHPDDESSKGAATTAYYRNQGVAVMVATCTGGERGDVLNPKMDTPENQARLPELRREEMAAAAKILDIEQVWLGFIDSGMGPELDPDSFAAQDVDVAAGALVQVIRQFRPQVVTTYDANGGYGHPDHIMTHRITLAAVDAAADPDAWPEHGPVWAVSKLYYDVAFHRGRIAALHQAMHEAGLESPYADWFTDDDDAEAAPVTTRVPCADFFAVRDEALRAHATQIDPDGRWFAVPLEIQQAAHPSEDYQLVRTRVPANLPEDDLFAGVIPGQSPGDWLPLT